MNTGLLEMSVLERQRAQLKCQFQAQLDLHRVVKLDPGQSPIDDFLGLGAVGYVDVTNCVISRKKRKSAHKIPTLKANVEDRKPKGIKEWGEDEGDSKISQQNNILKSKNENSPNNSKKNGDVQNTDYIHVRARRGQATDSHSLAERVRREKISARMKYLQDLVPGCDKITGKAGMLDEIISYVQSLQRQVEFLSMKLATVTPMLDNIDNFFTKEMLLASSSNFADDSLTPGMIIPAPYQLNHLQQLVSNVTAPLPNSDTFFDSFGFNQIQPPLNFGPELQNYYRTEFQQGTTISYPLQKFTGSMEDSNLKMEM